MQFPAVKVDGKRVSFNDGPTDRGFTWSESLRHKGQKLMKLLSPDGDDPSIHFRFASARRSYARKKFLPTKRNPASFLSNKSIRESPAGIPPVKFSTWEEGSGVLSIKSLPHFGESVFCLADVGESRMVYNIPAKRKAQMIFFFIRELIIDFFTLYTTENRWRLEKKGKWQYCLPRGT